MGEPRVDVLVINWNGREHLEACFDALVAQTYANARFILIDNASTDDGVAFVRERYAGDARVEVLQLPANLGWSGGNNAGIEYALAQGADLLLLLNNDTACAPDLVERLVAAAAARPEAGAFAPKMVLYDHPTVLNSLGLTCSLVGSAWDRYAGRLDRADLHEPEPVAGACGGAMLLRATTLARTGLLPQDFGIYLDDLDLCLRVWEADESVWTVPEAVVRHKFSATYGSGARAREKYFLNTRNRHYLMLRRFPAHALLPTLARLLLSEARAMGRAVLDGEAWRAWAHVRAAWAGLRYIPHARAERRRARATGLRLGACWPLLERTRMFSPPVVLPRDGWYPPVEHAGQTMRPMADRATHPGDAPLRVTLAGCYAPPTAAVVALHDDTGPLGTIEAQAPVTHTCRPAGPLRLEAQRVLQAEITGLPYDCGGWLAIAPAPGE